MGRFGAMFLMFLSSSFAEASTIGEAQQWMDRAEQELLNLAIEGQQTDWVKSTYITEDTEALSARANERLIQATQRWVKESKRFDSLSLPADLARKMKLLRLSLTLAAPSDPALSQELTQIVSSLEGTYGKGKYCPSASSCKDLEVLSKTLAESRDPKTLLDAWQGWHRISRSMRKPFARYVALANQGAREMGFEDFGAMWRSKYDMPPQAFAQELDRIWEQVKPLYLSLHAYVRSKLREKYGTAVPESGPIPAHLLGNMWAQSWDHIYPLVAPQSADPGYDLSAILKARKIDAREMVRIGERFFTSLGFAPLPKTFWERSLFLKPTDREVVCHASAWDIDFREDVRIKMCIDVKEEDFATIHHELGHNFYQRAYLNQPYLYRDSANDGFHEAVGDTIALSVTPEYLVKIGLLPSAPDASKDIGLLLGRALEKVAFLPFGLLIDQWRWKVFSGEIPPEKYNESWWRLRLKYQGVAPAVKRTEEDFDPGAKYHVAANVPYMRYFLAHILQFQFHRALAKKAGCTLPLHRCSIYQNAQAGRSLKQMLEQGLSRPWQEALKTLTGSSELDATAIRDYFAPLQKWLDEQNRGKKLGW